jgi:hypothetical protein
MATVSFFTSQFALLIFIIFSFSSCIAKDNVKKRTNATIENKTPDFCQTTNISELSNSFFSCMGKKDDIMNCKDQFKKLYSICQRCSENRAIDYESREFANDELQSIISILKMKMQNPQTISEYRTALQYSRLLTETNVLNLVLQNLQTNLKNITIKDVENLERSKHERELAKAEQLRAEQEEKKRATAKLNNAGGWKDLKWGMTLKEIDDAVRTKRGMAHYSLQTPLKNFQIDSLNISPTETISLPKPMFVYMYGLVRDGEFASALLFCESHLFGVAIKFIPEKQNEILSLLKSEYPQGEITSFETQMLDIETYFQTKQEISKMEKFRSFLYDTDKEKIFTTYDTLYFLDPKVTKELTSKSKNLEYNKNRSDKLNQKSKLF